MGKHIYSVLCFILCFFSSGFAVDDPKIYDCFLFFNELEILEIKLNELYDHVDYFVLVESTETFRGKPKPLYFNENKQRYSKFLDKIIHIVVEHFETDNPWSREGNQRNQMLRGLTQCKDSDFVIIEDADEIVRASKLPEIIDAIENRYRFVTCNQTIYTYFLNRFGHGTVTEWLGSVAARFVDVKLKTPQGVRIEERKNECRIFDAGWHFTYMGGIDRVRTKIESFSHSELDNPFYKDSQNIRKEVEGLKLIQIDETYPQFVREHVPYFAQIGFIDKFDGIDISKRVQ
ncbi:MAG TPA: hypothetical protein VLG76_08300 [Rhabdochlamydiaceae bacterium]|nr:hypothetical protein [Rhabdochlamydiaceae bacterium]